MNLSNMIKKNEPLKGIIIGLFSLFVLEFGTIAVTAGFNTDGQWKITQYFEGNKIYVFLTLNAFIAILLGIGIAFKFRTLKRVALVLNLIMFVMIIAGYMYFVWLRFSRNI